MRIKKMLSLFMALIMTLTLLPANVFAADDPTSPTLTKTAEWINQETGLAKITLTAEGTPIDVTAKSGADVLLVLDASGSMEDHATEKCGGDLELKHYWFFGKHYYYECPECGATYELDEAPSDLKCTNKVPMDKSRWEIATDAVEALADEVIPDTSSKNRLGLVVFSSRGYHPNSNECDLTNDSDDILDEIPSSPEGGTNYTTGLQRAYDMLNARTDKSRPGYVVFLTDGAPGPYGKSGNDPNWNGENQISTLKDAGITIYTVGFNLTNDDATNRLENYATKSEYAYNITDGNELSGLFTNIGSTIESGVTVWDTIDSKYFTLANKPGTNVRYEASNGTVQCTGDAQFVWNLDNFSSDGETLEIYIQLKSEYMNKNKDYPTNKEDSAYGKYVGADGSKVDLPISEENGSSAVPTLNVNKAVNVQFHFVGTNQGKATFDVPAQANQTLENGNKVTRPSVTVAPGYQITDWYETANCSGEPFDFNTPVTGNGTITLHARVDEDSSAKYAYQVEFYKNGVKSETVDRNVWAGTPSVTLGNAKTMKTGNYTNYSFTKAESGSNSYTQDGDVIAIGQDGNTVIKVYFTAGAVDLTFQRGDHGKFSASGDEDKASITKSTHFDANFNDTPGVTAELGWKSIGWYEAGDVDKNIVPFPLTITGAKTYVMKYEKNTADWKSVTFYLNDGTSAQYKVVDEILIGSKVSDSDWPSNPDRTGYEFKGWFTKDGTNGDWGTQFTQSTKVNETINVYAKWENAKTDVPVHYYLGSTNGTELTFSQVQKITNATIGSSYSSYINDALKGKGTIATNQNNYYEISNEKAIVYINSILLGTQTVNDGDMIQVVYPAKMGTFKVREYFFDSNPTSEQYLNQYEASLEHGSDLKYGASKTNLTISEINKILDESLSATRTNKPGAKIKSVSIEYQELNPSGVAIWQSPVTATLNATGTAVESFTGLDQLFIHGDCETRLTFEYELPIEIRVEYHKQYGDTDNYYEIAGKDYVVGGGTNYVFKNDELNIVENANSLNNINKVVPTGVAGYRVVRVATQNAPATPITTNKYKVTSPTTFIVYLDAITADGGKIVNIDNTGAPLEGGKFVFNQTNLTADNSHKNEYPISQDFVYGVEYTVEQTESVPGYDKVSDFKVKLKADGTGLELVGTVENVTVNGMTITVANGIDANQKFAYTVNRYIKGTETAVPGLPALTGAYPLGNFTWSNKGTTTTGYKLVTDSVQPTSLVITADATKNTANVYYEVDDSQTRSYKVTYWKDGESTPFDTLNNLTVLEADPMVAYESITQDNIPTGYELKGIEFDGKPVNPTENVVITSTQHEIKVIYQKKDGMWFDVSFVAGDHGKLNSDQDKIEWLSILKDTSVESLGGIPTANAVNNYEFIGWSTDGGVTLIQTEDLPKTITQSATYTAQWTQIYNVKYYVYEKKNSADKAITAKFDSEEEANAAVEAHISHNSALYSGALLANQSKISNMDFAKFAVSTKPDKKDRTETEDAKFANLIRNYQNTAALNAAYAQAPGYDVVPFRLVLEGSVVHVDCYLVKNPEQWTTITFKPGEHGKWADDSTSNVILDVIKGTAWSNYSSQVPANPVQNEIGWKLVDGVWDNAILGDSDVIPDNGLVYTAQWEPDNATVSFEIVGDKHGAENPANATVQKGQVTKAPVVTADKGYQVIGWYTDDGCVNAFDFSNATIAQDTKLYAKVVEKEEDWTTITFKVGDHGKWADSTTTDVVLDVIKGTAWSNYSAQVPANPVQNEIGWKLADGVWDNTILGDSDVIPDNGLVYTAVWTEDMADVTFQIKGIMVEGVEQFFGVVKPDSQSIQNGKMAKDPTATAIADIQRGYKLEGWYTDEACTNAFNFGDTISGNTVLYSKVSIKDEEWARVTFKAGANGTINDGTGDVETVITDPILIGNTIGRTIPSANADTGYEFNAWYKVTEDESGTEEVQETPTQDTEVLGNMTYLAKFSPLLNVNFIINTTKAAEGTTSPVTISGLSNGTTWASIADQVPNVQGKLREGEYSHDYKFTGWNADFPETVTSNLTFNAEFEDIYTFVVEHADLNGGSYPNESINYDKKEADDTISSQANAPKRGYELTNISVYVDENKLEATTTAELIQKLKDEYDITLTEDGTLSGKMPNNCIWIKYGYEKLAERTVQYISDGTVKNMPENIPDQYKGDEIEISTQVPQRDGYDFNGWKVVDDAVEVTDGTFIMPDSDVKLKAEWTPNEEVWNFTVEHYLEGSDTPFETVPDSVLKREPNIESVVLNAPQGYKFKEYQINGDPTELPITISEDGNTLSIIYEKNDLIVKHVYGDNTVYDTTQSKANVDDDSVVVNAVNSGRYTKLRSVTVNGEVVSTSRSITLDFSQTGKNEVEFVYRKKKSDSGGTSDPGSSSDNGSDFGEEVTILDEEVPLADGLNVIDHFAYIFGYKDGTVRPTNRISREEVAAIFYRLLSDDVRANMKSTTQDFPDVSGQRWSNTSIATLSNGGVIAGYPNGEFRPGNSITRAEFAVIVSKFDNLSKTDTNQFSDIENHWAKDFINSAALKGWISGYPDGTFHPNDYITRAEAMTLINSVLNRKVSKEGLLENAKYWSDNSEDAWYYEAVMEATNSHDYTRETPTGDETWTAITPDKTWD